MEVDWLQKLKPGVPKFWLHLAAALMWSAVGIFLNTLTYKWLVVLQIKQIFLFIFCGILLALAIYRFGFSKLAKENIHRIEDLASEKPCLFAFQKWTSYPLIAFMIGLGIFLRKYSPIPKTYLASMYIGIGGGLFLSSLHYYHHLWRKTSSQR
ncbi:MAG: hypothetical protein B6I38_01195 [Anaerolineaceae bacterium 4572_5.1]|nr:MAG: hypothetical protein B6I38_01195 [Anaerolineaceae bacterium 4572_5.1]RLD03211.1 MAG: hypothetical protein DRI56_12870 [Chloroflexota bacterium]